MLLLLIEKLKLTKKRYRHRKQSASLNVFKSIKYLVLIIYFIFQCQCVKVNGLLLGIHMQENCVK